MTSPRCGSFPSAGPTHDLRSERWEKLSYINCRFFLFSWIKYHTSNFCSPERDLSREGNCSAEVFSKNPCSVSHSVGHTKLSNAMCGHLDELGVESLSHLGASRREENRAVQVNLHQRCALPSSGADGKFTECGCSEQRPARPMQHFFLNVH